MNSVKHFFLTFTGSKGFALLLAPLLTVLISISYGLVGLFLLILLDLITGLRKDLYSKDVPFNPLKKTFWRTLQSQGLRRTWKKISEYGFGVIVFAVFEAYLFQTPIITLWKQDFTITGCVIIIAAIIELYSNWENIRDTGGESKFKTFVTDMLGFLESLLPDFLKGIFKKSK